MRKTSQSETLAAAAFSRARSSDLSLMPRQAGTTSPVSGFRRTFPDGRSRSRSAPGRPPATRVDAAPGVVALGWRAAQEFFYGDLQVAELQAVRERHRLCTDGLPLSFRPNARAVPARPIGDVDLAARAEHQFQMQP